MTIPPVGPPPPDQTQPSNYQDLKQSLAQSIHTLVTLLKQHSPDPSQVSVAVIQLANCAKACTHIGREPKP